MPPVSTSVAYLGPEGTFTHQAAVNRFGKHLSYSPKETIAATFQSISSHVDLAVIPVENSTYGMVVETHDLLRLPQAGKSAFIRGEVTISIDHCLVVRRGVSLNNIGVVLSHEQAIGQSSIFLSEKLPNAKIVHTSSTAAAARALLDLPPLDTGLERAAICSRLCVELYDGLEILTDGIQNVSGNFTRFFVLANSWAVPVPPSPSKQTNRKALLRVQKSSLSSSFATIADMLCVLTLSVTRLDRRPSLLPTPFHDVYFIEVESKVLIDDLEWKEQVEKGLEAMKKVGSEAVLLGIW